MKQYPDDYPTEKLMLAASRRAKPGWYIEFDDRGKVCQACLLGQAAILAGLDADAAGRHAVRRLQECLDEYPFYVDHSLQTPEFDFAVDESLHELTRDARKTIRDFVAKLYPTVADLRKAIVAAGFKLKKGS